jgi:hypothetical protein
MKLDYIFNLKLYEKIFWRVVMKKLLIVLSFTLTGCLDTVILTEDTPFVVIRVEKNGNNCKYRCNNGTGMLIDEIIAECGLFQIGDTIKLCK